MKRKMRKSLVNYFGEKVQVAATFGYVSKDGKGNKTVLVRDVFDLTNNRMLTDHAFVSLANGFEQYLCEYKKGDEIFIEAETYGYQHNTHSKVVTGWDIGLKNGELLIAA